MNDVDFYLNNGDINNWLNKIGSINRSAIIRKLKSKNSNDYLNLLAVIDELRIGAFLSEIESVSYDFNIYGKTPDWYIRRTNTIIEVKGINQIERDLIRGTFENKLNELIQNIKGNYFVSIEYNSEAEVNFFNNFDFDDFINKFSYWFSKNDNIGAIFNYKEQVQITILKQEFNIEFLEVGVGNSNFIHIDKRRLKNVIDEKLTKYKNIIESENYEFIVAIVSDIKNGIRDIDLKVLLYGYSVDNQVNNTKYSILNGLYYDSIYKSIAGIIFMIRGQKPLFYKNYSNQNNRLSNIIEGMI